MGNQDGYPTYTVGYLATCYLNETLKSSSVGDLKTMLAEMDQSDESFRDLIERYTSSATYQDFIDGFQTKAQDYNFRNPCQ